MEMPQGQQFQSSVTRDRTAQRVLSGASSVSVKVVKVSRIKRTPSCKSQRSNRSGIIHVSSARSTRRSIRSLSNSIHSTKDKSIDSVKSSDSSPSNTPTVNQINEVEQTSITPNTGRSPLSSANRSLNFRETCSAHSDRSRKNIREFDRNSCLASNLHRSKSGRVGHDPNVSIGNFNPLDNFNDITKSRLFQKGSMTRNGQKHRNRKGGLFRLCCVRSPLCKLLAVVGLFLLGGIIAAVVVISLAKKITSTTTTTTTTSATSATTTTESTTTSSTSSSSTASTTSATTSSSSTASTTSSTSSSSTSLTTTSVSTSTSTSSSSTSATTSTSTSSTSTSATTSTATSTTSTSATTSTATTTTTEFACSPLCDPEQTCIEDVCLNVGYLSCALTWSRYGDGDIVVGTPNGKTIYYQNKGPSNDTDQGKLDRDDKSRGPENVFWPKSGPSPPSGTYYVCFEPFLFGLVISTIVPVTVTYRIIFESGVTIVLTRKFTSTKKNSYNCDASASTLVGSFTYP